MQTREIIDADHAYMLQTYIRPEFVLERGQGCYLYDTEGRRYLDCVAGIAVSALGYADPDVAAVIRAQAEGLIHVSNLYHTREQAALAQLLVELSFADRVFFSNSGAEAIEGALKLARKLQYELHQAEKHVVVAFEGSFHGRTMGAVAVTAREKYRLPFAPVMPGVRFAPFNDLAAARAAIAEDVCAVLIEPIQGEGGISTATPEFLAALRQRCDEVGALLIFDEIQCGLGRTGTLWAHELSGVTPDIMTIAKPLGAGFPIGAILMTQAVADAIQPGDHGTTFGGGPFIAAVAKVVVEKIAAPAFLEHVREVGGYLDEALHDLMASQPRVTELRGRGLMRGVQVNVPAASVRALAHEQGLLLVTAGDDIIRLVPPLIIERAQIDELIDKLGRAIERA
ncbi:MAG: aspartate aminotransferase family protein [Roseiflexaceae bacterium]|nr:aspartate aminotransferase family protein [Roseiflexaceae bacterium]